MVKINTEAKKIDRILNRGVEEVIVREDLRKALASGRQLRVKLGFDPTGSNIHIGRAVILRKLREFQNLGHKIIFLVGDFTALIGDPSDKLDKRPMLSKKQIKENIKNYKKQVGKIVDLTKAEFVFNSKWLGKLRFDEIAELAETFTVQQMLARRNFKDRYDRGNEISIREFLYPLLQGYDSVQLKADVEIGGFDQLFNLKAGRDIQKQYGQREQNIMNLQMLEGTDGRKMSTSWGNVINIIDKPEEMFGKVMSIRDELIGKYFLLCTDEEEKNIEKMEKDMKSGELNPKEAKLKLAEEITTIYHGDKKALEAKEDWIKTFSEGNVPEKLEEIKIKAGENLLELVVRLQKISNSEARRLIEQGGIKINEEKEKDFNKKIKAGEIIKIGKKKFIRIK